MKSFVFKLSAGLEKASDKDQLPSDRRNLINSSLNVFQFSGVPSSQWFTFLWRISHLCN